jgi:hypothetical protein
MVASFFFVVLIINDYSGSRLSNKLTLLIQSLRNIIIILLILICELSDPLRRFHLHSLSLLNDRSIIWHHRLLLMTVMSLKPAPDTQL